MRSTRRDFIKSVGMVIASLAMARCIPFRGEANSPSRLRDCWLQLDWLAQQAKGDYDRGDRAREKLAADHRAALDDLVAAGELDADVADELNAAFGAAINHILFINAPITCYKPALVDYTPASSDQLAQQAGLLAEIAKSDDLDPITVAQAQAAIERDIAFLNLSQAETQAIYNKLIEAAGGTRDFPSFDKLDLEVTPEAAEAARFLVDLLLGETE